jgi:hypothetical protein
MAQMVGMAQGLNASLMELFNSAMCAEWVNGTWTVSGFLFGFPQPGMTLLRDCRDHVGRSMAS